jgi:hypothetical protein
MFHGSSIKALLIGAAAFAGCVGYSFHVASEALQSAFERVPGYPVAEAPAGAPEALQPRLVGLCGGVILYRVEEDQFPESGCDWIEPYRPA